MDWSSSWCPVSLLARLAQQCWESAAHHTRLEHVHIYYYLYLYIYIYTLSFPLLSLYWEFVDTSGAFYAGQDMVTKLLKMQMLSDDDELAYSPDSAR